MLVDISTAGVGSNLITDSTTPDTTSMDSSTLIDPIRMTWLILAPIIFVIGLIGNSLILVVMTDHRMGGTSTSIHLTMMAAADIVVLVVGLLPDWLRESGLFDVVEVHPVMCKLVKFLFYTAADTSIWILVMFTVDRFVAICFPLRMTGCCTIERARLYDISAICLAITKNFVVFVSRGVEYVKVDQDHVVGESANGHFELGYDDHPFLYNLAELKDFNTTFLQRSALSALRNATLDSYDSFTGSYTQSTTLLEDSAAGNPYHNHASSYAGYLSILTAANISKAVNATREHLPVYARTGPLVYDQYQLNKVRRYCGYRAEYEYWIRYIRPWIVFVTVYLVPFTIIVICNFFIIRALLKVRRGNIRRATISTAGERTMMQMTMMCLGASIAFLIFIGPSIFVLIGKPYWPTQARAYKSAKAINNLLVYVNHSINFFLYCITGYRFRRMIYILLVCRKFRRLESLESFLDLRRTSLDNRTVFTIGHRPRGRAYSDGLLLASNGLFDIRRAASGSPLDPLAARRREENGRKPGVGKGQGRDLLDTTPDDSPCGYRSIAKRRRESVKDAIARGDFCKGRNSLQYGITNQLPPPRAVISPPTAVIFPPPAVISPPGVVISPPDADLSPHGGRSSPRNSPLLKPPRSSKRDRAAVSATNTSVPYNEQNPPYNQQNPPYNQQNPPYNQLNPPYNQQNPPYNQQNPPYNQQNPLRNDPQTFRSERSVAVPCITHEPARETGTRAGPVEPSRTDGFMERDVRVHSEEDNSGQVESRSRSGTFSAGEETVRRLKVLKESEC